MGQSIIPKGNFFSGGNWYCLADRQSVCAEIRRGNPGVPSQESKRRKRIRPQETSRAAGSRSRDCRIRQGNNWADRRTDCHCNRRWHSDLQSREGEHESLMIESRASRSMKSRLTSKQRNVRPPLAVPGRRFIRGESRTDAALVRNIMKQPVYAELVRSQMSHNVKFFLDSNFLTGMPLLQSSQPMSPNQVWLIDKALPTDSTERRRQPRTNLSQVVRIRRFDPSWPPEDCTTLNVSQDGLYIATSEAHYTLGINVYVTSEFHPNSLISYAMEGVVVRVDKLENEKWGVAIHIFSPPSSTDRGAITR
jgi:PilZ domain